MKIKKYSKLFWGVLVLCVLVIALLYGLQPPQPEEKTFQLPTIDKVNVEIRPKVFLGKLTPLDKGFYQNICDNHLSEKIKNEIKNTAAANKPVTLKSCEWSGGEKSKDADETALKVVIELSVIPFNKDDPSQKNIFIIRMHYARYLDDKIYYGRSLMQDMFVFPISTDREEFRADLLNNLNLTIENMTRLLAIGPAVLNEPKTNMERMHYGLLAHMLETYKDSPSQIKAEYQLTKTLLKSEGKGITPEYRELFLRYMDEEDEDFKKLLRPHYPNQ